MHKGNVPRYEINLPHPPMGNKIFCTQQHGIYILEKGPAIWRCMSNTHSGTGGIYIYDGIPDEKGFFPDGDLKWDDPEYGTANGRLIFAAMPAVLGMWMEDGYCHHGLTLIMMGEHAQVAPCLTICWLPDRKPARKLIVEDDRTARPEPAEPAGGSKPEPAEPVRKPADKPARKKK